MRRRTWIIVAVLAIAGALWLWLWDHPGDGHEDDGGSEGGRGKIAGGRARVGSEESDDGDVESSRFPWKHGRASISGTITLQGGGRIAGAQVCAWLRDEDTPSAMKREPKCVSTSKEGRYRIDELPAATHAVDASAAQHIPNSWRGADDSTRIELSPGQTRDGIDIALEGGGVEIRGVVKDVAGGVIEGALASAQSGGWWFGSSGGGVVARTDERGEFSLWVKPGTASVSASAEGYSDGSRSGPAPGYTFEVLLTPESVVVGRVVRAGTDTPVADVRVSLSGGWDASGGTAYTEADGRFRIDRLKPGRYQPVARAVDGVGRADRSHLLGLGETSDEIVIALHAAVAVRGRVAVDSADGDPCPAGRVFLTDKTVRDNRASGRSRGDGTLEILGVLPGTYEVSASCEGHLSQDRYDDLVVADASIDDQVWVVNKGLSIRGVVVDGAGAPVARASVRIEPKELAPRAQRTASWGKETAADGTFEATGLLAGKYSVNADKKGLVSPEPTDTVLAEGAEPKVELVMREGGRITGRVRDSRGDAMAGVSVSATGAREQWNTEAMTKDDGSYEIDGVAPGEARVTARHGWTEMRGAGKHDDDVQGERVTVEAGKTVEIDLVVQDRAGKISGRVVDADGGPVADAFVQSTRESESATAGAGQNRSAARWGGFMRPPLLTDADGRFELDELEPGKHTVFATRKGGGEGLSEHVDVGTTDVAVRIGETGSISGKVALTSGGAPERFTVKVADKKAGVTEADDFFRTGGEFVIDGLPPGTYEVSATSATGDQKREVTLAEGQQLAGVDLELTPRVTVRGRIVDLEDGAPVPNVGVAMMPATGGGWSMNFGGNDKEHVSDADGRFVVKNAPAGKVRVMLIPMVREGDKNAYEFTNGKATIPADVTAHELPDLRVARRRLGREEKPGDLGFETKNPDAGVDWDEQALLVAVVRPGGPAETAGLKVGATILKVDGHDVTGEQRHLYRTLSRVPSGKRIELGLEDGKTVAIVAGKPK